MSNNINTQNPTTANVIAAKKLKNNSKPIQAAESLPKYSLYSELQKNDEFRKSVISDIQKTQAREKARETKSPILKFILATALVLFITRK